MFSRSGVYFAGTRIKFVCWNNFGESLVLKKLDLLNSMLDALSD